VTICLAGTKWGHYLGLQLRSVYRGRLLVCGRDPGHTRRIAHKLDADGIVIGWEAAAEHPGISAIVLALPPEYHVAAALRALAAGKHVLVEKPMAPDLVGVDAMIEAARENRRVLFVGENMAYRPAIVAARRLLARIGRPCQLLVSALNHQAVRPAPGILIDSSVHYIRAVRCLCGEPDSVFATQADGRPSDGPSPDNVTVMLSGNEGWRATLWQTWQASAGRCPELILTGTDGALKLWPESSDMQVFPNHPTARTRMVSRLRPWWLRELFRSFETQRVRIPLPARDRMGYQAEIREFLRRIEDGDYSLDSAYSGRRDVEIALAAQASLSAGAPVSCAPRMIEAGVPL
jgi:predicted dehydrogenase